MNKLLTGLCFLLAGHAMSQKFNITKVELSGGKINLYYDLIDTIAARNYTINLFSSNDNFVTPLTKAEGDLGLEVKPGGNRKIVWNALDELGPQFDGKVSLEVRGRVYIPFIRLDGLQKTFKRGVGNEITWTGGTQQNILNFDVYKGNDKITSFPNIANVGHSSLMLPLSIKPGSGYRFKITDTKNKDQVVYSQPFAVKRKIPLLVKAIPVVLIGGAAYLIASGNKGPANIPDPALPDTIN